GTNFLSCSGLKHDSRGCDLYAADHGFLAWDCAIVNRQIMEIGIDILPEPMVFVPCIGAELQTFSWVVGLAWAMINIAEVALDSARGGNALGQTLRVNEIIQLRKI